MIGHRQMAFSVQVSRPRRAIFLDRDGTVIKDVGYLSRFEDIELLSGRITKCVSCGLPLPLRRAFAGEEERNWICGNCGGRYRGVIDKDSHPDDLLSVHPAGSG